MTTRNVQTAIVLQGGGALGAYEYGVLEALYESRPGFRPVAVAGISIGEITAAVLGGAAGDPIRALDTLWRGKLTVASPVPAPWLPAPIDRRWPPSATPGCTSCRPGCSPHPGCSPASTTPHRCGTPSPNSSTPSSSTTTPPG